MAAPQASRTSTPAWLAPRAELQGFARYVSTVRERWWLVAAVTALATLAAIVYVVVAPKVYEAESDVLVTPVVQGDASTDGLGLITESNDPTQVVTTAARLISTTNIAMLAGQRLKLSDPPGGILDRMDVEPIAQSNLVSVRARAPTAAGAAALATGYAQAAVDNRTQILHEELDALIPRLQAQVAKLPPADQTGSGTLGERVADLQALRQSSDPTLRVAARAVVPTAPTSPKTKLSILAGIIGGLILGLGTAFLAQTLDPRLRRESQLRDLFRLPILARVPDRKALSRGGPVPPGSMPVDTSEAFRTLRATLAATLGDGSHSILVTSSAAGEGKTTTALNLAYAFASAGYDTILIEADLRRPTIAKAIGARPIEGLGSVLVGQSRLEDALFTVPEISPSLDFLLADGGGMTAVDALSLPAVQELQKSAKALADFVIIDSPPLTEVVDALALAQQVDAVLMVARLGTSRLNRLTDLGEMLAQGGIVPAGFALLGSEHIIESAYYYAAPPPTTRPTAEPDQDPAGRVSS
jgi:succinoglycan biosynthesis transport protein ExoP